MVSFMKIGFTSTTFRPIRNLEKIVCIAKRAGVDCIEWGGDIHVKNIESAKEVRTLCENAGIEICSYGSYYRVGSADSEKWENICLIADAMGAKVIRVWLGKKDSQKTDERYYKKILDDLISICETADKYGLIVSPECHTGTYNNNTDAFLRIFDDFKKKCDADNFKTYFQSKYKNLSYDFDRIERTLSEIEIVHISYSEKIREQLFSKKDSKYVERLLQKLKESGYSKTILIEYTYFSMPFFLVKDVAKLKREAGEF